MLYSEKELEKRLKAGCALYYFYASDEALVHTAAQKTLKYLNRDDPETTVLDGPTPSVEEIVLAAGTISFFGGKRLVLMPLIRPSTYSDKDLQELCDTLADTENAIFVLTSIIEESYGKLRPGKREPKAHCQLREARLLRAAQPPHGRGFTGHGPRLGEGGRCGLCPRRRSCAAGPLRRGSVSA